MTQFDKIFLIAGIFCLIVCSSVLSFQIGYTSSKLDSAQNIETSIPGMLDASFRKGANTIAMMVTSQGAVQTDLSSSNPNNIHVVRLLDSTTLEYEVPVFAHFKD